MEGLARTMRINAPAGACKPSQGRSAALGDVVRAHEGTPLGGALQRVHEGRAFGGLDGAGAIAPHDVVQPAPEADQGAPPSPPTCRRRSAGRPGARPGRRRFRAGRPRARTGSPPPSGAARRCGRATCCRRPSSRCRGPSRTAPPRRGRARRTARRPAWPGPRRGNGGPGVPSARRPSRAPGHPGPPPVPVRPCPLLSRARKGAAPPAAMHRGCAVFPGSADEAPKPPGNRMMQAFLQVAAGGVPRFGNRKRHTFAPRHVSNSAKTDRVCRL